MATVTLTDIEGGSTLTIGFRDSAPKPDGYGGWTDESRPKDKPITTWTGAPAYRQVLELLIDGYSSNDSVLADRNLLESWARPRTGETKQPTRIKATGLVLRTDPDIQWVVENLSWGESLSREDGALLRQEVTVSLLEYSAPDLLKVKTTGSSYKCKRGDTLKKIAQKQLGSSKRWTEIRDLNPKIRDPKKRLKAGRIIKMPLL